MKDYRIAIYDHKLGGGIKPMQNLSFSTYGPNNQDMHLQAGYRQTKDSSYIQGLPDGNIISFNSRPSKDPRRPHDWMNSFPNPMYVLLPA
jgi:serine/threonine-protein kinase/endoribonuclease IRE1